MARAGTREVGADAPVETKGEQRRARLLATLDQLLIERQLADISVSDLTSRSGVTRSGFYFYFSTKEAAVTALLEELFEEILVEGGPFFAGGADQQAALASAIHSLHDIFHVHRHLVLAILDARVVDESARTLWDEFLEGFVSPLAVRIEQDRRATPRQGATPEDLARVLIWSTETVLERDLRAHADAAHDDRGWVEALLDMWLTTVY